MKEITFEDKVYSKLVELPVGQQYDLTKKVSEGKREVFAEVVKEFIRFDYGKAWGFFIEFTNDYKSIYKKKY